MNVENPYSAPSSKIEEVFAPGEIRYASWGQRFGAFWLDVLVFAPLMGLSFWFNGQMRLWNLYYFVPGLLIGLWYQVQLVKQYGGTPGMQMLKIRVARLDGTAVGYKEAMLRYLVTFILSMLPTIALITATLQLSDAEYLSLGFMERSAKLVKLAPGWYQASSILVSVWVWSEFIVMLTNKRRRALHDYMAGTIVIRKP